MESTIGKRIRLLREAKQLSVADFAKAAGVKPENAQAVMLRAPPPPHGRHFPSSIKQSSPDNLEALAQTPGRTLRRPAAVAEPPV